MANAGPDTNGSQFFIMHQDYPLPKSYTIFGQVREGMEAVNALATASVTATSFGERSRPLVDIYVERVEIAESSSPG
jgi:cyclophilin family peptidyl-prolyl cis-trans isomerase